MLRRARFHNQDDTEMFTDEYLISQERPIELPIDYDIDKEAINHWVTDDYLGFAKGAKWLKSQILKQIESC